MCACLCIDIAFCVYARTQCILIYFRKRIEMCPYNKYVWRYTVLGIFMFIHAWWMNILLCMNLGVCWHYIYVCMYDYNLVCVCMQVTDVYKSAWLCLHVLLYARMRVYTHDVSRYMCIPCMYYNYTNK